MSGTRQTGLAPSLPLPARALLAAAALVLAAPAAGAQEATEVQPYSLAEIVDLVSSRVPNKKIISYARTDCIGFALDDAALGRLRGAGADAALIDGLRGACRGAGAAAAAAAPAQAPVQTASRPASVPAKPASSEPPVPVRLRAAIVGADFVVRALPQVEFVLIGRGRDSVRVETNLDGVATASLAPGDYELYSRTPIEVSGRKYHWALPVTVAAGMQTLELTQKNANRPASALAAASRVSPPVPAPSAPAPAASTDVASSAASAGPAGAPMVAASTPSGWATALGSLPAPLAPRVRGGVFTVSGTRGRGTGVLVDPAGVVLTSASLVDADGDVRVQLDSVTRVRARVVEVNRQKGVAVLRVALGPCRGCSPLRIASAASGAQVFAVSAPGSRGGVSSGTVSKADGKSVATDLDASREQAGAPLITPDGSVLGLVADAGRVVPVADYAGSLAKLATSGTAPSDSLLPVLPGETAPASLAAEVRGRSEFDVDPYTRQLDAFRIVLMTPQVAAWRQAAAEKEAATRAAKGEKRDDGRVDPIQGWVDWADYARARRPVVLVGVAPRANNKQSVGRGLGSLLGAVTGKINVGDIDLADDGVIFPYYGANELKEFYGDVRDVTILKDGEPLEPVEQVRLPAALNADDYASKNRRLPSQVVLVYRAEDFGPRPGGRPARFQVLVRDAASKEGKLYELDRRMIASVWQDAQQAMK